MDRKRRWRKKQLRKLAVSLGIKSNVRRYPKKELMSRVDAYLQYRAIKLQEGVEDER